MDGNRSLKTQIHCLIFIKVKDMDTGVKVKWARPLVDENIDLPVGNSLV